MIRDAETCKDDLRTGTPVWLKTPHISVPAGPLPQRSGWDAVVIGAGISGALVAETSSRAGRKVLVLDRRAPVRGSTPASTAMIEQRSTSPCRG